MKADRAFVSFYLLGLTCAWLALACTPHPVPVPTPDADAAPTPDCIAACSALSAAGCARGVGDGGDGCVEFMRTLEVLGRTPNASTHKALTCADVAAVRSVEDARRLGFVCPP